MTTAVAGTPSVTMGAEAEELDLNFFQLYQDDMFVPDQFEAQMGALRELAALFAELCLALDPEACDFEEVESCALARRLHQVIQKAEALQDLGENYRHILSQDLIKIIQGALQKTGLRRDVAQPILLVQLRMVMRGLVLLYRDPSMRAVLQQNPVLQKAFLQVAQLMKTYPLLHQGEKGAQSEAAMKMLRGSFFPRPMLKSLAGLLPLLNKEMTALAVAQKNNPTLPRPAMMRLDKMMPLLQKSVTNFMQLAPVTKGQITAAPRAAMIAQNLVAHKTLHQAIVARFLTAPMRAQMMATLPQPSQQAAQTLLRAAQPIMNKSNDAARVEKLLQDPSFAALHKAPLAEVIKALDAAAPDWVQSTIQEVTIQKTDTLLAEIAPQIMPVAQAPDNVIMARQTDSTLKTPQDFMRTEMKIAVPENLQVVGQAAGRENIAPENLRARTEITAARLAPSLMTITQSPLATPHGEIETRLSVSSLSLSLSPAPLMAASYPVLAPTSKEVSVVWQDMRAPRDVAPAKEMRTEKQDQEERPQENKKRDRDISMAKPCPTTGGPCQCKEGEPKVGGTNFNPEKALPKTYPAIKLVEILSKKDLRVFTARQENLAKNVQGTAKEITLGSGKAAPKKGAEEASSFKLNLKSQKRIRH